MQAPIEAVKSRPILMQAESVRAILDGRKTQTRRVMKPQPYLADNKQHWIWDCYRCASLWAVTETPHLQHCCPYGSAGDCLWVKESWAWDEENPVQYRATDTFLAEQYEKALGEKWKWRNAMLMPRAYSRITLEICAVRVERLQDISEEDAYAEGCLAVCGPEMAILKNCREVYRDLWESIHGKGAWERNDWVWVIDFRRVTL